MNRFNCSTATLNALIVFVLGATLCTQAVHAADTLVSLRTWIKYSSGKPTKGESIREWKLRIPQGFSVGRYRAWSNPAYDPSARGSDRDGQILLLSLVLLDSEDNVVPYAADKRQTHRTFGMSLSNGPLVYVAPVGEDFCLTADQIDDMLQSLRPPENAVRRKCQPGYVGCRVSLSYHGWNASAFVDRNGLYQKPDEACRILRRTLDNWTIAIDDLRK